MMAVLRFAAGRSYTRRDMLRLVGGALLLSPGTFASQIAAASSHNLTDKLREFVDSRQIAGAVAIISRSDHTVYLQAVGTQDLELGTPMNKHTIFDVRSMTKVVTATAVMCLVEDGKLSLDEAVSTFLPEFANIRVAEHGSLRRALRSVTLLDLLTHTSGMGMDRPTEIENITRVLDRPLGEVVQIIAKQPLQADPGGKWNYSSMGYAVLGRVVEVRSGEPYQDFVQRRILRPLKMGDSFFFPPHEKWPRIAAMYNIETGVLRRDSVDIYRRGAKYPAPEFGLFSTARDMERFFRMMLNEGILDGRRVLSPQSTRTMLQTRVTSTDIDGVAQGLAWFICTDPEKQPALRISKGSFGAAGASGTFGWADPKQHLIRLLFMQRFGGSDLERDAFMGLAANLECAPSHLRFLGQTPSGIPDCR
jgi:CubicO group peptidase (beta-lactamase class C family)